MLSSAPYICIHLIPALLPPALPHSKAWDPDEKPEKPEKTEEVRALLEKWWTHTRQLEEPLKQSNEARQLGDKWQAHMRQLEQSRKQSKQSEARPLAEKWQAHMAQLEQSRKSSEARLHEKWQSHMAQLEQPRKHRGNRQLTDKQAKDAYIKSLNLQLHQEDALDREVCENTEVRALLSM